VTSAELITTLLDGGGAGDAVISLDGTTGDVSPEEPEPAP
jgi:hypothetical protein